MPPVNINKDQLAALLEKFLQAPAGSSADRMAKDQLLDELQDAVGMAGKMATEKDIVRRAETLLAGR
jgi:hypothetical protein